MTLQSWPEKPEGTNMTHKKIYNVLHIQVKSKFQRSQSEQNKSPAKDFFSIGRAKAITRQIVPQNGD